MLEQEYSFGSKWTGCMAVLVVGNIDCMDMKNLSICCWLAGWTGKDWEKDKHCSMAEHKWEKRKD